MIFVFSWLVCGIIAAMIGSKKGESCLGFIIGALLGPIGILLAILSRGNRKACPSCKEMINKKAKVCPHCQRDTNFEAYYANSGSGDSTWW
jgi:hypothetical protein